MVQTLCAISKINTYLFGRPHKEECNGRHQYVVIPFDEVSATRNMGLLDELFISISVQDGSIRYNVFFIRSGKIGLIDMSQISLSLRYYFQMKIDSKSSRLKLTDLI